ncbi:TonB-dependent siderophore receptor [Azonexus sp.]|uniref:TonB-dependent receptor plug domain-containing protein n=1 Tax=Azonexus sp. TaxID=1872668 RepID=UPI0027BA6DDA|nr:TonB-dependent receptor [Azonexus sp.]
MKTTNPSSLPRLRPLSAAILFALTVPLAAEEAGIMPTVVVTAASYAQDVKDVQASVQVVSRRDIESTPGVSLLDSLDQAVGVDTRGTSLNSTVSMRGMTGSGTLILFDGMRRTQKYGSRDINLYGTEDVEQIEIVRGPMSALYGADASGGVINVITRQPKLGSGLHGGTSVTYGQSRGKQRETDLWKASLEYGGEMLTHRFSVEQRNRDDYRVDHNSYAADLKGVDETYINYQAGLQVAPGQKLRLSLERARQDDSSPGELTTTPFTRFSAYEREDRDYGSLNYTGEVGPGILSLDASRGTSDAKTTRAYPLIEQTDYTQTQYAGRYVLPFGDHTLTLGIGQQNDKLSIANNTSREGDRTNNYVLAQGDIRLNREWSILAGVRHDRFNEFGDATTPRLSLQYTPGNWRFRAGYGEAFRAPTVLEQYATFRRGTFLILGSETLEPEESRSFELAAGYAAERIKVDVSAYQTRSKNLITTISAARLPTDPASVRSRSVYANIGQVTIEGIELSAAWQISQIWSLRGAYEHIDARDDTTGDRLTGRPGNIARMGLRFEQAGWTADLLGRYYFNYYNSHNTIRGLNISSDYGTADLKIAYRFNKQFSVATGVTNLFDKQAPDNWGSMYAVEDPPTRFFYLSGSYRF